MTMKKGDPVIMLAEHKEGRQKITPGTDGAGSHFKAPEDAGKDFSKNNSAIPTILLVDDDMDILNFLRRFLNGSYNVITARNGNEAVALLKVAPPDLIVTDVSMPGVDGFAFARRLRLMPEYNTTPLIFLTSDTEIMKKLCGMGTGINDYHLKPFYPAHLLNRINRHLAGIRKN